MAEQRLASATGRVSDVRIASDSAGSFVTFTLAVSDGSGRKLALRKKGATPPVGPYVTVTFDDDTRLVKRVRPYAS